jgi:hypothetical protein
MILWKQIEYIRRKEHSLIEISMVIFELNSRTDIFSFFGQYDSINLLTNCQVLLIFLC